MPKSCRVAVDPGCYGRVAQPQTGLFLRFDWPVCQGGLRQNQVRLAKSRGDEAQTALDASNTAALREGAVAFDQVQTGPSQHDAAAVLRSAAQAAFDPARDALARGVGPFTSAVDASAALDGTRAAVTRAQARALANAAGLWRSPWEHRPLAPTSRHRAPGPCRDQAARRAMQNELASCYAIVPDFDVGELRSPQPSSPPKPAGYGSKECA